MRVLLAGPQVFMLVYVHDWLCISKAKDNVCCDFSTWDRVISTQVTAQRCPRIAVVHVRLHSRHIKSTHSNDLNMSPSISTQLSSVMTSWMNQNHWYVQHNASACLGS
jgi:hypothetical protein